MGDVTMRGVTGEIALGVKVNSTRHGADDDERIELDLRGELNRRDFGLTWNQVLETGGALLGNKVKIALETQPCGRPRRTCLAGLQADVGSSTNERNRVCRDCQAKGI